MPRARKVLCHFQCIYLRRYFSANVSRYEAKLLDDVHSAEMVLVLRMGVAKGKAESIWPLATIEPEGRSDAARHSKGEIHLDEQQPPTPLYIMLAIDCVTMEVDAKNAESRCANVFAAYPLNIDVPIGPIHIDLSGDRAESEIAIARIEYEPQQGCEAQQISMLQRRQGFEPQGDSVDLNCSSCGVSNCSECMCFIDTRD